MTIFRRVTITRRGKARQLQLKKPVDAGRRAELLSLAENESSLRHQIPSLYQGMASAMPHERPNDLGFSPCYVPPRSYVRSKTIPAHQRTFFATSRTSMGRRLFQSERNAMFLVDVLRCRIAKREFQLHDFLP